MKVKDLLKFNPDADVAFIDDDHVLKPLVIYGCGGGDGCNEEDCENVIMSLEGWEGNSEQ